MLPKTYPSPSPCLSLCKMHHCSRHSTAIMPRPHPHPPPVHSRHPYLRYRRSLWTSLLVCLPCLSTHYPYDPQLWISLLMHLSPTIPCPHHHVFLCHSTCRCPCQRSCCQTHHLSCLRFCFCLSPPCCLTEVKPEKGDGGGG